MKSHADDTELLEPDGLGLHKDTEQALGDTRVKEI